MGTINDWIRLGEKDLETHMMRAQLGVLHGAVLGPNERDPLPELLEAVTWQVRTAVGASGRNLLSSDGEKIPGELRADACALVLEKLQSRIPALRLTPDQVRAADQARQRLRSVEKGEVAVSRPADPAFHLSGGRATMVCLRGRLPQVAATSLGGL
jgi:hypothetical protein